MHPTSSLVQSTFGEWRCAHRAVQVHAWQVLDTVRLQLLTCFVEHFPTQLDLELGKSRMLTGHVVGCESDGELTAKTALTTWVI